MSAQLVSYKRQEETSYSTFSNTSMSTSTPDITLCQTETASEGVNTGPAKTVNYKSMTTNPFPCHNLICACCPWLFSHENVDEDADVDFAVLKYHRELMSESSSRTPKYMILNRRKENITPSQKSTLKIGDSASPDEKKTVVKLKCGNKFGTRKCDTSSSDDEINRNKLISNINKCGDVPDITISAADSKSDDGSITSETNSSPLVRPRSEISKSATPSPAPSSRSRGPGSVSSSEWPPSAEDDIDRLVALHQNKSNLSTLGVRSDSMASVYSGAGEGRYGTVTVKGQVEFGLQYNYKAGALEIIVKQCRDLAPVDTKRNRSDPYVKVYLLPDKSKSGKRKTKVKKHTLNPVFDETLKFHISLNGLETRTLWLTVWHSDMFGRNDFLGEVMMTLENKVFDEPTPKWYHLEERTEPFDDLMSYKGDIIVGLKFVPPDMTVTKKGKRSKGALHVLIKEAKNLTAVKANGTSDPFCKSYLLPDKGRNSKQKTPVLRRTVNPFWNYTFVYDDVSLQELSERSLELTIWDHDRLASNEFLGGVRFSLGTGKHYGKSVEWMDATGKEISLWQNMLERPNFWVEGSLALRSSLENRSN